MCSTSVAGFSDSGSAWRRINSTLRALPPACATIAAPHAGCWILTANGRRQPRADALPQRRYSPGANVFTSTTTTFSGIENGTVVLPTSCSNAAVSRSGSRYPWSSRSRRTRRLCWRSERRIVLNNAYNGGVRCARARSSSTGRSQAPSARNPC